MTRLPTQSTSADLHSRQTAFETLAGALARCQRSWTRRISSQQSPWPPFVQNPGTLAAVNESLRSYPDEQRGGNRTTGDQSFSSGKCRKFIDVRLAELFGRFNNEPLIIRILDPHRDQRIALAGHIRIELAWALADNCKSNAELPTFSRY